MKIKYKSVWQVSHYILFEREKCENGVVYINLAEATLDIKHNARPGKKYCHNVLFYKLGANIRTSIYVTDGQLKDIEDELTKMIKRDFVRLPAAI